MLAGVGVAPVQQIEHLAVLAFGYAAPAHVPTPSANVPALNERKSRCPKAPCPSPT